LKSNFSWSKKEKKIVRKAFDEAYQRECSAIIERAKEMLTSISAPHEIWKLHDLLTESRDDVDLKYDYRYSVLISVFSRLMREGWLKESDLVGLSEEKIERITSLSKLQ
jgi:hypothetical protein